MASVAIPANALSADVDKLLSNVALADHKDGLTIDLSQVKYIEIVSLICILSAIARIRRSGITFQIKLPVSRKARDFLRGWKFPAAVRAISGVPFVCLVEPSDRKYFGENRPHQEGTRSEYLPSRRRNELTQEIEEVFSGYYFPIQVLQREEFNFGVPLALRYSQTWQGTLISNVLNKCIGGGSQLIPTQIIFEAISNAVRHPNATVICTGANIQHQKYLTITWWDDGVTILDTLTAPLKKGAQVRIRKPEVESSEFTVRRKNENGIEVEQISLVSDEDPNLTWDAARLLLAAFFPAVSRAPESEAAIFTFPEEKVDIRELRKHPGMGLYYLLEAAIDILGGTVSVRSGDLYLNLKRHESGSPKRYLGKVENRGGPDSFLGNLLTVRLPLNRKGSTPPSRQTELAQ